MKIRNTKLDGEQILLSNVEVNQLGPEAVLAECDVHSDCEGKALSISGMVMRGGRFIQQDRALMDFHFELAHFAGVKFVGEFNGCTFGDWDDVKKSSIEECDFTDANLEDSRFLNCDVNTIRFPKWPSFTIINPAQARSFVLSRQWSPAVGVALDVYTDTDPECVAMCGDAARLAKRDGVLLQDLHTALRAIPGILIIS